MILIQSLCVGYQNVPKVATTSMFAWLYQSATGKAGRYDENKRKKLRRHYFMGGSDDAVAIENKAAASGSMGNYYRFALTRDPLRRFLSMYSNRVCHFRELSENAECAGRLADVGLVFDPQIDELVRRLGAYLKAAPIIMLHTRPMMDFLGPDLSVFNRIADIGDAGRVTDEIRAHWMREGMTGPLERAPEQLARKQTSGPKLGLEVLAPETFERLLDYYCNDYATIPTVSLHAIKDEYSKARAAARVSPIVFPPLDQRKRPESKRKPGAASVIAEKTNCPLVQTVKVKIPPAVSRVGKPFALRGVVLLKPDAPADGWELVVADGMGERPCQWGLPSPRLAGRFPDHPLAANSRFRLAGVRLAAEQPAELCLRDSRGNRYLVMRVKIRT